MLKAGEILQGRYRIEKQIGAGGMGAVFVATDERFGSTVAIKETLFTDERLLKAFEREARLLNSLRHPALPKVSDHFVEENGQFIVMEYIAGDDLAEMMEHRGGAFPLVEVLNWADQLLDALDFLHTQEMPVIHRDIKPQNLKLTPRGQIILLDFGLAKGSVTNAESLTAAKSVFGYSRNYASLEQIQGTGTDPRSDLYSLAATLYHLMTGAPPSDALTRAMSVLNGEKDPLIPAHHLNQKISAGVSEVLNRAMALNANHRPSSAAAMRELLREGVNITDAEEFKTIADVPLTASLFTQNTAVMTDAAKASELKTSMMPVVSADFAGQTDAENETSVKTKIQSESNPKSTTIQPLAEMTQTGGNKKRRFAAAAVALIGLLAVCSVTAALYVFKPEIFQHDTSGVEKKLNLADAPKNESNATVLNVAPANVPAVNTAVETVTTKKENLPKTDEKITSEISPAAKNNSKDAKPQRNQSGVTVGENTDDNMDDDDEQIPDTETKDVIIKDGVVTFKNPKPGQMPINIKPLLTREQLKQMTPEERRKLRRAFQLRRTMPVVDPPPTAPQPKPNQ
jgi:serine/threonine protein kinase